MNTYPQASLSQIVNQNHKTASVFKKYNLDFCCNGKRTLEEACRENNIALDGVLEELKNLDADNNTYAFSEMSLNDLIDHILSEHHAYVKKELPQIYDWLLKVTLKHGPKNLELFQIQRLFETLRKDLLMHMHKEEVILFPIIRNIENSHQNGNNGFEESSDFLDSPVKMMEQEHETAGKLMTEIRKLSNNFIPPQNACTTYNLVFESLKAFEEDLQQHMHLENNLLFPKAKEQFSGILAKKEPV